MVSGTCARAYEMIVPLTVFHRVSMVSPYSGRLMVKPAHDETRKRGTRYSRTVNLFTILHVEEWVKINVTEESHIGPGDLSVGTGSN